MNRFVTFIPYNIAWKVIVFLNAAVIIFHLCVISGFVPYDLVWGGNLQNKSEMYVFEIISIAINMLLVFVVLKKGLNPKVKHPIVNMVLWIFVVIFTLNTIGNLAAEKRLEMLLATPLTFVLSVMCWRVAIETPPSTDNQ